jgi:uncharacterized membrane protein YqhA
MIKQLFENIICSSRWMIIIAVVSSLVAALVMTLIGMLDVFWDISIIFNKFGGLSTIDSLDKELVLKIVSAIDAFLVATVLLIFGLGLYELFISKLDSSKFSSRVLLITNLEQLKEKLAKVIIMVLIVNFFKIALNLDYKTALDLLYLGFGVFLISLSVYFNHGRQSSPPRPYRKQAKHSHDKP